MVCCVTGHRSKGFPFEREELNYRYLFYIDMLRNEIGRAIYCGCDWFVTGMAEGADLDFAEIVIDFRYEEYEVSLEAALPYPWKNPKRESEFSEKCDYVLQKCDKKTEVSDHYFKGCMQKRNRYMVDKSDVIIAVWNGKHKGGTWDTIKYAREQGKEIRYIMLNEIE